MYNCATTATRSTAAAAAAGETSKGTESKATGPNGWPIKTSSNGGTMDNGANADSAATFRASTASSAGEKKCELGI